MDRAFQNLQEFINHALDGRHSIGLLEAGCGSATYINFAPKTYIIGIDISEKQLERNETHISQLWIGNLRNLE
jgi:cyclopropane fatty-acyl-phospholipid synthase-like methyltransferase